MVGLMKWRCSLSEMLKRDDRDDVLLRIENMMVSSLYAQLTESIEDHEYVHIGCTTVIIGAFGADIESMLLGMHSSLYLAANVLTGYRFVLLNGPSVRVYYTTKLFYANIKILVFDENNDPMYFIDGGFSDDINNYPYFEYGDLSCIESMPDVANINLYKGGNDEEIQTCTCGGYHPERYVEPINDFSMGAWKAIRHYFRELLRRLPACVR